MIQNGYGQLAVLNRNGRRFFGIKTDKPHAGLPGLLIIDLFEAISPDVAVKNDYFSPGIEGLELQGISNGLRTTQSGTIRMLGLPGPYALDHDYFTEVFCGALAQSLLELHLGQYVGRRAETILAGPVFGSTGGDDHRPVIHSSNGSVGTLQVRGEPTHHAIDLLHFRIGKNPYLGMGLDF